MCSFVVVLNEHARTTYLRSEYVTQKHINFNFILFISVKVCSECIHSLWLVKQQSQTTNIRCVIVRMAVDGDGWRWMAAGVCGFVLHSIKTDENIKTYICAFVDCPRSVVSPFRRIRCKFASQLDSIAHTHNVSDMKL